MAQGSRGPQYNAASFSHFFFYYEDGIVPEFISVMSLVCGGPSPPELWECWPSLLSPLLLPESPGEGPDRGTCDMALGGTPS